MGTALTKTSKGGVDVTDLMHLRDTLLDERQRMTLVLAQIEKVLSGVKVPESEPMDTVKLAPARTSPLDKAKAVTTATADLREGNGNLSAVRVAKLYGVSLSQLAEWLGRTKQAMSKTPDADSLQDALGYFERVARLRLITKDDGEFRKWLRTPHELLDNARPLELMAKGEWQAMADYVDDMLTGAPT